MNQPAPLDGWQDALAVAQRPGFWRWHEQVRRTGGCADPIHMAGGSQMVRLGTGDIVHDYDTAAEPGERLLVACGNRRTSRCPPCAERYRADTYQLVKAGLVGGKGVPENVRKHPRVFATFTAPSFGPVHHHLLGPDGQPAPCHPHGNITCGQCHRSDDQLLGQPLDPCSYDYLSAVIWNAMSPKLWHATMTELRRELAALAGISQRTFPRLCRLSFGKVAEYQLRCLVHFHAVFRLDGIDPDNPADVVAPPPAVTLELLEEAIRNVVARVTVTSPDCEATGGPVEVGWGEQLDIRPITAFDGDQVLSDNAVAGYIAKYATQDAGCTGTVDRSICCRACRGTGVADPASGDDCKLCDGTGSKQPLDSLKVSDHARRMIHVCWNLGGLPELASLRLRPWAHMLGFGGHFSTKSRRYSTTLSALRNVRRDYETARLLGYVGLDPEATPVVRASLHKPPDGDDDSQRSGLMLLGNSWYAIHDPPDDADDLDDDTVLVLGHWRYAGRGHSPGEAVFARSVAQDIADNRRHARLAMRTELGEVS